MTVGIGMPAIYLFTAVIPGLDLGFRCLVAVLFGPLAVLPAVVLKQLPDPKKQKLGRYLLLGLAATGILCQSAAAIARATSSSSTTSSGTQPRPPAEASVESAKRM
ncbi:hypothetical protein Poli38472_013877 [Pythium oligandrum]|uniref:Uncharacterized protein n=1 Tax=Pythium oligandrum TaxID=41045 RepID=A0A8K1C297_PYTOL|nr:hypothetical protein Poli38472_013877 [Pythium oligandrum]|eukprot:TMW55115.1 hypothetical protein Poli38472_013877 [Pythium oligandrum]